MLLFPAEVQPLRHGEDSDSNLYTDTLSNMEQTKVDAVMFSIGGTLRNLLETTLLLPGGEEFADLVSLLTISSSVNSVSGKHCSCPG